MRDKNQKQGAGVDSIGLYILPLRCSYFSYTQPTFRFSIARCKSNASSLPTPSFIRHLPLRFIKVEQSISFSTAQAVPLSCRWFNSSAKQIIESASTSRLSTTVTLRRHRAPHCWLWRSGSSTGTGSAPDTCACPLLGQAGQVGSARGWRCGLLDASTGRR